MAIHIYTYNNIPFALELGGSKGGGGEVGGRKGLKGLGNEADFLGFLQKSVRHRFLTLNFEPFRFGLSIRGDIHNQKTTPRLAESGSRQECL